MVFLTRFLSNLTLVPLGDGAKDELNGASGFYHLGGKALKEECLPVFVGFRSFIDSGIDNYSLCRVSLNLGGLDNLLAESLY